MHNLWRDLWKRWTTRAPTRPRSNPPRGSRGSEVDVNDDALGADRRATGGSTEDLLALWTALVDVLPLQQRIWLSASRPLALHQGMAVISVPDDFTKARLEGRLRTWLEDTLGQRLGSPVRLAVSVDPRLDPVGSADRDMSTSVFGDQSTNP